MSPREFPAEVLEDILLYSVKADPPVLDHEMRVISPGWQVFFLVNRTWNRVASTCGRAWANAFTQIPLRAGSVSLRSRGYSRHVEFSESIPAVNFLWEEKKRNGVLRHSISRLQRRQLNDMAQTIYSDLFTLTSMHTLSCTWPYDAERCVDTLRQMSREQGLVLECLQEIELSTEKQRGHTLGLFITGPFVSALRCPSLRVARLTGIWTPLRSNYLEELTVNMSCAKPTRPPLRALVNSLLADHADHLKVLRLIQAFRQDFLPPCQDPFTLSRTLHMEIAAEFGEAYQFLTRYTCTCDIETLRLDISFDPGCEIAELLDKLAFTAQLCNRFHVSVQGDPLGDHGILRILAWKGDGTTAPDTEDISQRKSPNIDLRFRPAFDGPWDWESAVGKCLALWVNGTHGVLILNLSPFFYLHGRCQWGSIIPHLSAIRYVYPYKTLTQYCLSDDAGLSAWAESVQEWNITP